MRVVHIIYSFNPGGAETFLLTLTSFLKKTEAESYFISFNDGLLRSSFENFGAHTFVIGSIRKLSTYERLFSLIKTIKPNVLNNHIKVIAGLAAIYCKLLHIPYILTNHSTHKYDNNASAFYKIVVNVNLLVSNILMTKGIAVSEDACKAIWGQNYKKRKAMFISLGIDFRRYAPTVVNEQSFSIEMKKKYSIPLKAYVIANVAGYRAPKNYKKFIEIASCVLKQRSDVYFMLIGEGSEREKIERQIKELGIANKCRLTGYLPNVPEILKSMVDIFLFTSIFEGLGLALVEAQAAGVFCLYSDVVPKEAIINKHIVKPMSLNESSDKWANSIIERLSSKIHIDKEKAYQTALDSNFNMQNVSEMYVKLWNSIVNK